MDQPHQRRLVLFCVLHLRPIHSLLSRLMSSYFQTIQRKNGVNSQLRILIATVVESTPRGPKEETSGMALRCALRETWLKANSSTKYY